MICSKCKLDVEGSTTVCPHCGANLEKTYYEIEDEKKKKNVGVIALIVISIVSLVAILFVVFIVVIFNVVNKSLNEVSQYKEIEFNDVKIPSIYSVYDKKKVCGYSRNNTPIKSTKVLTYCDKQVSYEEYKGYSDYLVKEADFTVVKDYLVKQTDSYTIYVYIREGTNEIEYDVTRE